MKVFKNIMRVISIALVASTLICGLYLSGQSRPLDVSSLQFHMTIGIAGILFSVVTMFLPGKKVRQ